MAFNQPNQTSQSSYPPDQLATGGTWPQFPVSGNNSVSSGSNPLQTPLYPFSFTGISPYEHLPREFRPRSAFEGHTAGFSDSSNTSPSHAHIQAPLGLKSNQHYGHPFYSAFPPVDLTLTTPEGLKPGNTRRDLPFGTNAVSPTLNPFNPINTPSSATSTEDHTDDVIMTSSFGSDKSSPGPIAPLIIIEAGKASTITENETLAAESSPPPRVQGSKDTQTSQSISSSSSATPSLQSPPQTSIAERRPRRAKSSSNKSTPKPRETHFHTATRIPVNQLPTLYNEILSKLAESEQDNVDKYAVQSLVISLGLQNSEEEIPAEANARYEQLLQECLSAIHADTNSKFMNHGRRKHGRVELEAGTGSGDKDAMARYDALMETTPYRVERLYRNSEAAARYVWTRGDFVRFKEAFRRFGYAPTANRQIAEYVGKGMHPNHIQYFKRALKQRLGGNLIRDLIESSGYDSLIAAAPLDDGRALADFLPPEDSSTQGGTKILFGSTVGGTFFQSGSTAPSQSISATSTSATTPSDARATSQDGTTPAQAQPIRKRGRPPKNRGLAVPSATTATSPLETPNAQPPRAGNLSPPSSQIDLTAKSNISPNVNSTPSASSSDPRSTQPSAREGMSGKRPASQLPQEATPAKRPHLAIDSSTPDPRFPNSSTTGRRETVDSPHSPNHMTWSQQNALYNHSAFSPFQPSMVSGDPVHALPMNVSHAVAGPSSIHSGEEEDTKAVLSRLMKQTAELQAMVQKLSSQQHDSNQASTQTRTEREHAPANSSTNPPYMRSETSHLQVPNEERMDGAHQPSWGGHNPYQAAQQPQTDVSPNSRVSGLSGPHASASTHTHAYNTLQPTQSAGMGLSPPSSMTQMSHQIPTAASSSPSNVWPASRHPMYHHHSNMASIPSQHQMVPSNPTNRPLNSPSSNMLHSVPSTTPLLPSPRMMTNPDMSTTARLDPSTHAGNMPFPPVSLPRTHPADRTAYGPMRGTQRSAYGQGQHFTSATGASFGVESNFPPNAPVQYPFPFQPGYTGTVPTSRANPVPNQTRNHFGVDTAGLEEELLTMDDYPPRLTSQQHHPNRNMRG